MLTKFRYKNWVRLLKSKGLITLPDKPLSWDSVKNFSRSVLIALPNDNRHIHVVNHYLGNILKSDRKTAISVLIPADFADFILGMRFYRNYIVLPPSKPLNFPVTEDMLPELPSEEFPMCIDLNETPFILSHYIIATRGKEISLGFHNDFTDPLFTMTLKTSGRASYDKGFQSLLRLAGIE